VIRLLALLTLLLVATPALALESNRAVSSRATVSLVSNTDAVAPGTPIRLGLLIRLAPGWHTYWRNPGDAGAPPELRLDLPRGASAGPLAWPTPAPLREGPILTYAYTGEVLLPLSVIPGASGLDASASASWLVCKDICVPEQATFRLALPQGQPAPSAEAPLFAEAERRIPRPSPWAAHIAADGTLSLGGPELGPATVARAWFMPDQPGVLNDAAPQGLRVAPGALALALTPASGFKPDAGLSGVVVVRDRAGLETAASVNATPGPPPPTLLADPAPLWRLWGLAFLGGAILNLMPCVFPVLALKAIGLARGVRAHAISYTAGILAAFAVMGGALMAARASGGGGWGFQFASPAFVAATAWVMLAIGLNLAGVFRVGAGRLAGTGQGWASRGGHAGSFATGLLAVLVATPCTAPFMAGAVAGALAAPPAATLSVFAAMGLGLATPFGVLACVPGLGRFLPRPGRWMERLRNVLALPMFAAAAWLLWVLSQEVGPEALWAGLAGSVLVGGSAWLVGITQQTRARARRIGAGGAAVALAAALALLPRIQAGLQADAPAAEGGETFSPSRLAALREAGRPVFVDMTAAWCVTCLVNERVAIDTQAVRQAFQARNVAYLKGDWTRQDPALTGFLRANGRDGVPLYLFYPERAAAPMVLPQVLTAGTVLAALGGQG
jgi:DsbC/DsbD-like thiol-disulfide interchange protein/cytochrome c biogenesis protein CcdA